MKKMIITAVLAICAVALHADPMIEWGNMIGDDPLAPALFRITDGMPYDFIVIIKISADSTEGIDTARIRVVTDTASGFYLPPGEVAEKTCADIPANGIKYLFWHVSPPGGIETTYVNALRATSKFKKGGATDSTGHIQRDITVTKSMLTDPYAIHEIVPGISLRGHRYEIRQTITNRAVHPLYVTWGLYLGNYTWGELIDLKSDYPGAAAEPQTTIHFSGGLPIGTYETVYTLQLQDSGATSVHTYMAGLTGNWRNIDTEMTGSGYDTLEICSRGCAGAVSDGGTGDSLPDIPLSVYLPDGTLYDSIATTMSNGAFAFGIRDTGTYVICINDTARSDCNPDYETILDDNGGAGYLLAEDSVIVLDYVLHKSTGVEDAIRISRTGVHSLLFYDIAGKRILQPRGRGIYIEVDETGAVRKRVW